MQVTKLTDEQHALLEVTRNVLEDESGPAQVRELTETGKSYSRRLWSMTAEIGLLGLEVPESAGGSGQTYHETALVLRELGRAATPGPYLSHTLAVSALNGVPAHQLSTSWLERLALGDAVGAVVLGTVDHAGYTRLGVSASKSGAGIRLNGVELDVPDIGDADLVVVAARTDDGPLLVGIPDPAARLGPVWQPTHDRTRRLFDVTFADVEIPSDDVLAVGDHAQQLIDELSDRGATGIAFDSVGGLSRVLDMTVEYTSQRVQYGRIIATFQAVKHTCADMYVETEVARIAADAAALEIVAASDARRYWSSVAKFRGGDAYARCAGDALQMHGGIGMTWEFDLHFWLKRAKLNQALYGRPDAHRARVARLI